MNKIHIVTLFSCISCMIFGQQKNEDKRINLAEANRISYIVTVSHDAEYDQERWDTLIEKAANAIEIGRSTTQDESADALVAAFIDGIKETYKDKDANGGIYGEMTISISDSRDDSRCSNCPCVQTKGTCPCIGGNTTCEKIPSSSAVLSDPVGDIKK